MPRNYRPRRAPRRRNKKRGFGFSGEFGRNVPFVGGSKFNLGTRAVKSVVRRELGRQEETKIVSLNQSVAGINNQSLFTYAPLQYIAAGTDDSNRIGRKIFARHLKIKGCIRTDGTQNIEVRWMVVWLPASKAYAIPAGAYSHLATGVGSTDLFYTATNQINALLNNRTGARVICDRKFRLLNQVSGQATCKEYSFDCPLMTSIQYLNATARLF